MSELKSKEVRLQGIIQQLGGYSAVRRILANKPSIAVYWDKEDSTYVKNFTVNKSDEFEWQYLANTGAWNYCNSEVCPVTNGDFVELDQLQKLVPLSTHEYLQQYYLAHQTAQCQLALDQHLIKTAEVQHVKQTNRHAAFWIYVLIVLAVFILIVRGCV